MGEIYLFPGGNTPCGFVNRFDGIMPAERARRVYFIKGGSGVGKSTFMRAVAEHCTGKGLDAEYFNCSSDPASLDAVAIPALGAALMDATAPHMMDPALPGVRDFMLDLGQFLDERRLEGVRSALEESMMRRRACFERAYVYLSAALPLYRNAGRSGAVLLRPEDELTRELERLLDLGTVRAEGWLSGMQGAAERGQSAEHRGVLRRLFADAITPAGFVSTLDTLPAPRRVRVELPWGCDASGALERLADGALRRGEDALLLLNPLVPERALHLYLPARGALICADGGLLERSMNFTASIAAVAGERPGADMGAHGFAGADFDRGECMRLLEAAVAQLNRARELHAEVEGVYSSAMDFDAVHKLRDGVCSRIDALTPQK